MKPTPQSPCWVRIAALQKSGRILITDSEVLSQEHARRLFTTLKERGFGMHAELWSSTMQKMIDQFSHDSFPDYARPTDALSLPVQQ